VLAHQVSGKIMLQHAMRQFPAPIQSDMHRQRSGARFAAERWRDEIAD
jgi:hypothetical protein